MAPRWVARSTLSSPRSRADASAQGPSPRKARCFGHISCSVKRKTNGGVQDGYAEHRRFAADFQQRNARERHPATRPLRRGAQRISSRDAGARGARSFGLRVLLQLEVIELAHEKYD